MQPPDNTETAVQRYVREALAEVRANNVTTRQTSPLQTVILEWFDSQPFVSRHRRYSMAEIAQAITDSTGHRYQWQAISNALESLGWSSGRDWTRAGRNRRWHRPPTQQPISKE